MRTHQVWTDFLADILFGYVMAQMLQQIRERAQHEGIALQHEVAGGQATRYVTWVDDLALRQSIGGQGPHSFGSSSVSAVFFFRNAQ